MINPSDLRGLREGSQGTPSCESTTLHKSIRELKELSLLKGWRLGVNQGRKREKVVKAKIFGNDQKSLESQLGSVAITRNGDIVSDKQLIFVFDFLCTRICIYAINY